MFRTSTDKHKVRLLNLEGITSKQLCPKKHKSDDHTAKEKFTNIIIIYRSIHCLRSLWWSYFILVSAVAFFFYAVYIILLCLYRQSLFGWIVVLTRCVNEIVELAISKQFLARFAFFWNDFKSDINIILLIYFAFR